MSPITVVVCSTLVVVYAGFGLKYATQLFWCLGTSHNGHRPKYYLPMEIGYLVGMIMLWPLILLFLRREDKEPKRLKEHKGPVYVHRYNPNKHFACFGTAINPDGEGIVVVYQDIETKQLHYCSETYFESNMMLISK